jgi:hypothetical protein
MLRDFPKVPARSYGPDSTPEEIALIKQRMYEIEPSIFIWHEIPIQSSFSVRLSLARLNELGAHLPSFSYIVDLREAVAPTQEVRATLVQQLNEAVPKLRAIAVWTEKNVLMNVAAKFVIAGMGLKKACTLHKTLPECLQTLRNVRG